MSGPPPVVRTSDGRVYVRKDASLAFRAATGGAFQTVPSKESRSRTVAAATAAPDPWGFPELHAAPAGLRTAEAPRALERAASTAAPDAWGMRAQLRTARAVEIPCPRLEPLAPHAFSDPREANGIRRAAAETKAPNAWGVEFRNGVSRLVGDRGAA